MSMNLTPNLPPVNHGGPRRTRGGGETARYLPWFSSGAWSQISGSGRSSQQQRLLGVGHPDVREPPAEKEAEDVA